MSTHRNIDRICIVVLVLTLLLTVAFMNGEKLGITVIADEDAESYSGSTYFTANDLDGDWADNAYTTYITLDGSGGKINGNGAYFLNGDLVISNGGWYVLSGTLEDGSIIVDAYDSSKIWIRLNGVTVNCTDDACLQIDQADKVFVTLSEGTENSFTSGDSYSEDALSDNTGGTIFSHDDLTINGSGSLKITAAYKHGIDVNDSLVITGGNITITAPQDGIHVNDSFRFAEASMTIEAGDDAVHSDDELYVESGTILITSCYEGLEAITIDIAGGDITVYPSDDGFNANGGDSDIGFGGMPTMNGEMPTMNGEMPPMTGEEAPTTGEEASMAGEELSMTDEEVSMTGEEAPMTGEEASTTDEEAPTTGEGPQMTGEMLPMFSGDMPLMPEETAQAADGSSYDPEETYIRISGGTITIINENGRDADGLDSNGNIYIDGGTILVSLIGDGGNCAIDYGSEIGGECIVTGGSVLAFGDSSMAEEFSSACTQCAVLYNLDSVMQAGTLFRVMNGAGEEILSYTPECSYSSVAFSTPALTVGETYEIICGESSAELTIDSTAMSTGNSGGTGGMRPGGMGGMQPVEMGDIQTGRVDGMQPGNMNSTQPGEMGDMQSGGMDGRQPGEMSNMQPGDAENTVSGSKPVSTTAQAISNGTALNELSSTVWLLLGISVFVLAAAVVFAKHYRKH